MKISKHKIGEIINQVLKENNSRLRGTMLDFNPAAGFTSEEWYWMHNPEGPPAASPAALARMGLKDPSIPEGPGGHSGESEGPGEGEGEDPEPRGVLDYAIELAGGLEGLSDLPPETYNKLAQYVTNRDAMKAVEKGQRDVEEAGPDEYRRQQEEQKEAERHRKAREYHKRNFTPAALEENKDPQPLKEWHNNSLYTKLVEKYTRKTK